jgi:hypothetical protein
MFFIDDIPMRSHQANQLYGALFRSSQIMAAYLITIMPVGAQF